MITVHGTNECIMLSYTNGERLWTERIILPMNVTFFLLFNTNLPCIQDDDDDADAAAMCR